MTTDVLTPEQRHLNMTRIRSQDTKPELTVRRVLHASGLRYRLQVRDLPGKPDLVFPRYRAVLFVHGCFWHMHGCPLFKWPKSREEFWRTKLGRNAERDAEVETRLLETNWRVLTVWECALKGKGRISETELASRVRVWLEGSEPTGTVAGTYASGG
ncbi:DNA mismatch endonuclease Vsr [Deinococcus detaillensis]|uniref:Very short patch repair endonuclease n=1 Tax=Deinococcus detaillensis TaxID=2592048 RepID=A0A553UID2_9DEIO|nr:very short patch repair endonuclease [Deinococcus detaillensis]TSA79960.1 DNA mismatch endonuclease Vsr [Deinococcus detaillensis]